MSLVFRRKKIVHRNVSYYRPDHHPYSVNYYFPESSCATGTFLSIHILVSLMLLP